MFKSNDGGLSWVPLTTSPEFVGELHLDLYSPDIVYANTASTLYRSSDAGGTWPAIANGLGVCCLAFDSLAADAVRGLHDGILVSWSTPRRGRHEARAGGKSVGTIARRLLKILRGCRRRRGWTSDDRGLS